MAPLRAKKPTVIERIGAHVKRNGLTYALAGTALGLGLAGTVAANNYNLMDGALTGVKTWARPLFRPPMRTAGTQADSLGVRDSSTQAGTAMQDYNAGYGDGVLNEMVGNVRETADFGMQAHIPHASHSIGTGVETYDAHRRGVRPVLRVPPARAATTRLW